VDSSGNAYITGQTTSADFPTTTGAYNGSADLGGCSTRSCAGDAFVTKLNSTGDALVYSTYLGGSNTDQGNAIAVDASVPPNGNAYVTGYTDSTDFPTFPPVDGSGPYHSANAGGRDAFVTELTADGSALLYSTYLGGTGSDQATGVAIDTAATPNIYVAGFSFSIDFPTTSAKAFQPSCSTCATASRAFVAKLAPLGGGSSDLLYSTYFGGSGGETANGITVDGSGNAYIVGGSYSTTDFPATAGAFQTANNGGQDAFVANFDPAATGTASLLYSTLLGGSNNDGASALTVDSSGNIYITGFTDSSPAATVPFPTKNPLQPNMIGSENAFVAKIKPAGLIFSTYLGGAQSDQGKGIALDSSGNIYLTGTTTSADFPTANAPSLLATADGGGCTNPSSPCNGDAFVTKIDPTGSAIIFSTFLGGSAADYGNAIAVDILSPTGVYVTGQTASSAFPVVPGGVPPNALQGTTDAFVSKFSNLLFPAVALSPSSLSFGTSWEVGTTSDPQPVNVKNVGDAPLTITDVTIPPPLPCEGFCPPNGQFNISNLCPMSPSTLAAGTSCAIDINFQPFTGSLTTGTLDVLDDAAGSPQAASLSGTGLAIRPLVSFSGPTYFGNISFPPPNWSAPPALRRRSR